MILCREVLNCLTVDPENGTCRLALRISGMPLIAGSEYDRPSSSTFPEKGTNPLERIALSTR